MKIKVSVSVLICSLLLSTFNSVAQGTVRLGPYLGFGFREMRGNSSIGQGGTFQFGLLGEVSLNDKAGLLPLISYVQKGGHTFEGYFLDYYSSDLRLNYFSVSLPLKWKADKNFFFLGGIQGGVLLGAEYAEEGQENIFFGSGQHTASEGNAMRKFHALDLGITAGMGFQFRNGMGIDLRTDFGLIRSARRDVDEPEFAGSNFTLMMGYFILIKTKKAEG
ncbi:MAG: PorT family protein [Flavobacteriales bacterium]|nr:PorT family protein [Flavobacteriales bacterium]